MNAGVQMKEYAGIDEAGMDLQHAARIMHQARRRAQQELAVRRPLLFLTWGVAMVVGYGALWLSVRGQRPYHGPTTPAIVTTVACGLAAAAISAWLIDRASSGVGGPSVPQRGAFALSLVVGAAALGVLIHVMAHAGADRQLVTLLGAAGPLLVAGLVLVASCAANGLLNWPRLALGLWLLAVAAEGGWAGPVSYLAVIALAGGGGILLMAVVEPLLRRV